ncbi:MAG: 50S ribosomal protein L11, partial [Nanoarchaeota archaeon]|nr:50S ribosomal protein L11 [Nanoarchaeota archaeon]
MALIKLLVEGGNMTPSPAIAQQLGPMGINIGQVISQVNTATSNFKGITVPVHLNVDTKTKKFTIRILSPPTSELIKKEIGVEKGSGARMKQKVGNLAIEQIIAIAKSKHDHLLSNSFLSSLKSVIGTCMAVGTMIENKDPKEVLKEIEEGKYNQEIKSQKTEVSEEKKKVLKEFFDEVQKTQEEVKKAEEAEKAAKEESKATAPVAGSASQANQKK